MWSRRRAADNKRAQAFCRPADCNVRSAFQPLERLQLSSGQYINACVSDIKASTKQRDHLWTDEQLVVQYDANISDH